jgi:cyclic pyranopterin phosphate synthase
LTTNGSQLTKYAVELKEAGINRINISMDSLDPILFKALTRTGNIEKVIQGIDAAISAGIEHIKINAVILRGRNDLEVLDLVEFVRDRGIDISFIEEMPLGEISSHNRAETYYSSDDILHTIGQKYTLKESSLNTGGPSKYWKMEGSVSKVGLISPHSHNFCGDCNRVRVTVEGKLLLCLGNENAVDLKQILRENDADIDVLKRHLILAMNDKPKEHHFTVDGNVEVVRFMSMTGG